MTAIEQLQLLGLTEADFDLIVKALDYYPEKGTAGLMLSDLVGTLIAGHNKAAQHFSDALNNKKQKEHAEKAAAIKEEATILQGKLLLLKRYLKENAALREVDEIINQKKPG